MPAISTDLFPNSVIAVTSVTVTGAADAAAALGDASDASFVDFSGSGTRRVRVNLQDFTPTAGHRVYGVRVQLRYKSLTTSPDLFYGIENAAGTVVDLRHDTAVQSVIVEPVSPYAANDPNGINVDWTDTQLDALRLNIHDNHAAGTTRVYRARATVLEIAQPVVSGIVVTRDDVLGPGTPLIGWTFSQGQGQDWYRVKVFSEAQATAGGFDPETTTPLWDSGGPTGVEFGDTASDADFAVAGRPYVFGGNSVITADNAYRIYVKAGSQMQSALNSGVFDDKYWSDWQYVSYVRDHNPNTPALLSPAAGTSIDATAAVVLVHDYTHPGGILQGAWALRRSLDLAGYQYWDNGASSWGPTVVWNSGAATAHTVTGFTNGHLVSWSAAVKDAIGGQSQFAADSSFRTNGAPSAATTAPPATVTTTTRPAVTWSFTDPQGNPQDISQVRTFTAAQYGASGFDPGASVAVDDSGLVGGPGQEYDIPVDLSNAVTYRSYVRVHSSGLWSAWTFAEFTLSLTVPTTPAATVTFDPSLQANEIDITGDATAQTFDVEFSDDFVTWQFVRFGKDIPADPVTHTAFIDDIEMVPHVPRLYRVTAKAAVGLTNAIVGSIPALVSVITWTPTQWYLRDPFSLAATAVAVNVDLKWHRPIFTGKFYPDDDSGRAVIVADPTMRGVEGTATFWIKNDDDETVLDSVILPGATLILTDPIGQQWYVQITDGTDRAFLRSAPTDSRVRRWAFTLAVPLVEVSRPAYP